MGAIAIDDWLDIGLSSTFESLGFQSKSSTPNPGKELSDKRGWYIASRQRSMDVSRFLSADIRDSHIFPILDDGT